MATTTSTLLCTLPCFWVGLGVLFARIPSSLPSFQLFVLDGLLQTREKLPSLKVMHENSWDSGSRKLDEGCGSVCVARMMLGQQQMLMHLPLNLSPLQSPSLQSLMGPSPGQSPR